MSDDPARQAAAADQPPVPAPIPVADDETQPLQAPYIQITEVEAGPLQAGDALERRDAFGRVPVVVRVRRQPPIKIELVLIAIALGASGVLLPVFLALKAIIIVVAIAAVVLGLLSRLFIRVPAGAVALVMKAGMFYRELPEGNHAVNPLVAMTHVVTLRRFVFDVPVHDMRAADGVNVSVDLLVTLQVTNARDFVYQITTGDADQLVRAACLDAVRRLIRGLESLDALDLGPDAATKLSEIVHDKVAPYGLAVAEVAFTHITLPSAITASLEGSRLAAIQLQEEAETFLLAQRRLADRAALTVQEEEARRAEVERTAESEALRLAKLEERINANPRAAAYDLEVKRIGIARKLAGNSRAIVSLGSSDLVSNLLVGQAASEGSSEEAASAKASASAAPAAGAGDGEAADGETSTAEAVTAATSRTRRTTANRTR